MRIALCSKLKLHSDHYCSFVDIFILTRAISEVHSCPWLEATKIALTNICGAHDNHEANATRRRSQHKVVL